MPEGQTLTDLLIEAADRVIVPERKEKWISYVNSTNGNIESLRSVIVALGLIMLLDDGADMGYVIESFNNNECPKNDIAIRSLVANYSLRGPEFFEKTATGPIPLGNMKHLEKLKNENIRIDFIHKMKQDGYTVNAIPDGPILVTTPDIEYVVTLKLKKNENE